MTKQVLDVGNCAPDHSAISSMLNKHFDVEVRQAHGPEDTLSVLRDQPFDLVLVNRKLDQDYSDGIEIIRTIKQTEGMKQTPCMLVTNFNDHQQAAVDAGALRGFGKLELEDPQTIERLSQVLVETER